MATLKKYAKIYGIFSVGGVPSLGQLFFSGTPHLDLEELRAARHGTLVLYNTAACHSDHGGGHDSDAAVRVSHGPCARQPRSRSRRCALRILWCACFVARAPGLAFKLAFSTCVPLPLSGPRPLRVKFENAGIATEWPGLASGLWQAWHPAGPPLLWGAPLSTKSAQPRTAAAAHGPAPPSLRA